MLNLTKNHCCLLIIIVAFLFQMIALPSTARAQFGEDDSFEINPGLFIGFILVYGGLSIGGPIAAIRAKRRGRSARPLKTWLIAGGATYLIGWGIFGSLPVGGLASLIHLCAVPNKRDATKYSEGLFGIRKGSISINFPMLRFENERPNLSRLPQFRSNGKFKTKLLTVRL